MTGRQPNVLYLHSHDTGRYLEPYGYPVPTPNIMQLANQGIVFREAFCAVPTCSGSRAALLTGQYGHNNGMLGLAHRGWALNDYGEHIVHTLRDAGYWSAMIGEQHIAKRPDVIGYDRVVKVETSHVEAVAPIAIELLASGPQQPWFFSIGFFETHREFFAPSSVGDVLYSRPPENIPDHPDTRRDMAAYKASARSLDQGVGAVLQALDEHQLVDDTLGVFTTDHGLAFPGAKATLYDRGIGVTLIMRGPGGFAGGRVVDALVSHLDIYPTLCDLAGIDRPDFLQGESLLPLARREVGEIRDALFVEATFHAAYEPQRAIRTQGHKYIRRFGDRALPVLANTDDGPSKDLLLARGWGERPIPFEQLYDVSLDPNEAYNVIDDPAYADVRRDLAERLERWMRETGDPLLAGPVAPPPGAEINTPDQRSPSEPTVLVQ
jgi:N-sulfoglucosamine sulfohydrolase